MGSGEWFLYDEFHVIYFKTSRVEAIIGCFCTDQFFYKNVFTTIFKTFSEFFNHTQIARLLRKNFDLKVFLPIVKSFCAENCASV